MKAWAIIVAVGFAEAAVTIPSYGWMMGYDVTWSPVFFLAGFLCAIASVVFAQEDGCRRKKGE